MSGEPIRIDIPDAKPVDVGRQAGQIVIDAIEEAGLDPLKSAKSDVVRDVIRAWGRGEYSRADVIHVLRMMLILNPSLASSRQKPR